MQEGISEAAKHAAPFWLLTDYTRWFFHLPHCVSSASFFAADWNASQSTAISVDIAGNLTSSLCHAAVGPSDHISLFETV